MNCLSISRRGQRDAPSAWIKPSESGLAILTSDESAISSITGYLATRGSRCFLFVDEVSKREDGSVIFREREASPSEDGYFPAVARNLTFHSANNDQWIFRPASLKPEAFVGAKLIAGRDCISNLFTVRPITKRSQCKCPCGAIYPAGSRRCPSCRGDDPLGWALSRSRGNPATKLASRIPFDPELASNHGDLQKLISGLQSFVDRAQKPPEGEISKPDKAAAKILLAYFTRLFSAHAINERSFKSLSKVRERKYLSLVLSCARRAAATRRLWRTEVLSGWMPGGGFQRRAMIELSAAWEQPIRDIREAYLKIFMAAAMFKPVAKPIRAAAERGPVGEFWQKFGRHALTAFVALKTFGVSLAMKGAFAFAKSQKDKANMERFSVALANAITASQIALESAKAAKRNETQLQNKAFEGLGIHLYHLLLADYSKVPFEQHRDFAANFLSGIGVRASGMEALRERGPAALKKARLLRFLIGAFVLASLAVILWMLFR